MSGVSTKERFSSPTNLAILFVGIGAVAILTIFLGLYWHYKKEWQNLNPKTPGYKSKHILSETWLAVIISIFAVLLSIAILAATIKLVYGDFGTRVAIGDSTQKRVNDLQQIAKIEIQQIKNRRSIKNLTSEESGQEMR